MIKFRAIIDENTMIYFTLKDLGKAKPIFSIRELLKPWLAKGNIPDRYIEIKDDKKIRIYENDIVVVWGHWDRCFCITGNMEQNCLEWRLGTMYNFWDGYSARIIGNKHLNPELLEPGIVSFKYPDEIIIKGKKI